MNYQDNDTLNAAQQNKNQSNADKSKNKDAMTAKLLASVAAGLAVGAGATYAAEHLMATKDTETEEVPAQESAAEQASAEPAKPTVEERVEALEEKDRIREQQEQARQKQEAEHQRHEAQRQKNEEERQNQNNKPEKKDDDDHNNDPFKGHEVKIETVEERTLEDGTTVHVYSGTIDGHQAAFMDDGNGKVVAAIVDANDNGSVDENEVIDLRESNVTTQYMASHQVASANHEIEVISVHNDVEMGGETVDVAIVSMDNQPVMFVDANQNGEVDVAIADTNQNGSIDEGEVQDVSGAHISMPTADDITGNNMTASTDDGMEDYSNDADVTVYDV